ncbi:F0F1 ATP synthase subunit delta [bacterium]|nr:F0F1 ATP synthase subunit delta [bacterium]
MEKLFEELAEKIKTKEELIFYLEELSQAQQAVFKGGRILLSEKLKGKISEEFKKFLEKMEERKMLSKNPDQQYSFLEKIKKYLLSLPEVKLEIAFSPSNEFLKKISLWFEKKLNQKVILDLTVNPKIVGGAIIEYQGNWRDYSLAKEIDKLIEKN